MPVLELISNELCPYTQRAAILLAEKGIAFERRYLDLAAKPDWFLALSPLGKVPLLRVAEGVVFETVAICEYIEEALPGRPLLAGSALARAQQRSWAEFASACIADVFGLYMAADAAAFERQRGVLATRFAALERALGDSTWFAGAEFGLVDAAFAPLFRLFESFDRIADFGCFDGLRRLPAYRGRLAARASVQAAVLPDYAERFERYLAGCASYLAARVGA